MRWTRERDRRSGTRTGPGPGPGRERGSGIGTRPLPPPLLLLLRRPSSLSLAGGRGTKVEGEREGEGEGADAILPWIRSPRSRGSGALRSARRVSRVAQARAQWGCRGRWQGPCTLHGNDETPKTRRRRAIRVRYVRDLRRI